MEASKSSNPETKPSFARADIAFNCRACTLHFIKSNTQQSMFIENAFKNLNYNIYSTNCNDGFEYAAAQKPDIIIIDLSIQHISGIALCKKLKHDVRTGYIPVVLLTDSFSDKQVLEGLESGCDDYISKTISPPILCGKIKNLINTRRRLNEGILNESGFNIIYKNISISDQEFIVKAHQIVMDNMANSTFEAGDFAMALNISRAQLYRKINSISGQSVKEFIRTIRLKKAAEMLIKTSYNISGVAYIVGFSSIAYFTRSFNQFYGLTPSKYISEYNNKVNKTLATLPL